MPRFRALRILNDSLHRALLIVVPVISVTAPLPHTPRHIQGAARACSLRIDSNRSCFPDSTFRSVCFRSIPHIAPRPKPVVRAAGGLLPEEVHRRALGARRLLGKAQGAFTFSTGPPFQRGATRKSFGSAAWRMGKGKEIRSRSGSLILTDTTSFDILSNTIWRRAVCALARTAGRDRLDGKESASDRPEGRASTSCRLTWNRHQAGSRRIGIRPANTKSASGQQGTGSQAGRGSTWNV
jgi:hypothetical protein